MAVKDQWVEGPFHLKFYFGEFFLGSVNFCAMVRDAYFSPLSEADPLSQLPVEELKRKTDVLCLLSFPVQNKLPRVSFASDSIRYVPALYPRYYVETRGTFAEYLQKFSGKTRRELLRQVRKFEKDDGGKIDWREFKHPDEMAEFQDVAHKVSQKTYQARLLKLGIPDTAEYLHELQKLAQDDRIRGYILYFGGSPIVFHLCIVQDGILLGQQIGYDPAFGKYSPGTIEQYLLIEQLFIEKQFERFDFGSGESSYKEFFATGKALCADVFYYRRNARNLFIVAIHTALTGFSDATVKLLEHLKLKKWLKDFFRFRISGVNS